MLPFSPSQLPIRTAVPAILLVTAVDQPCRPGITAFDFEESNLQRHGKPRHDWSIHGNFAAPLFVNLTLDLTSALAELSF
jgi:hypothetical protein